MHVAKCDCNACFSKYDKTSISPLDFLMYNRIKQIGIDRAESEGYFLPEGQEGGTEKDYSNRNL